MTDKSDDSEVFARHLLAARKRALRYLMRALERQALQLAIQARRGVGKARSRKRPKPFNAVTQLRREVMPLVAQLAELAAGGTPMPQQPPPSKNGAAARSRRRSAREGSGPAI